MVPSLAKNIFKCILFPLRNFLDFYLLEKCPKINFPTLLHLFSSSDAYCIVFFAKSE